MTIRFNPRALTLSLTTFLLIVPVVTANADDDGSPANLVVSRSVYDNRAENVSKGQSLPPNCTPGNCVTAAYDGTYPTVWNNAPIDGSFGITARIFLDYLSTSGSVVRTIKVPSGQMVTSFSSKSELALNLSTDGQVLTFMGYDSPINAVDVSNSNTPGVVDSTNPVPAAVYRMVAEMDRNGHFEFTRTNAYSGNNGRAAIEYVGKGGSFIYTSGNAGNGGNPQPSGILLAAGAQILMPAEKPKGDQTPGSPTPLASFNITQLGDTHDKIGKDNNFRGLTIFNNVVYFTKGSGGNGINTLYFVDSTGTVCSDTNGIGLPAPGATLPTMPLVLKQNPPDITVGLDPNNMCVLKGFPTTLAKNATMFPFGVWFANATTVYVADEGDGAFADASSSMNSGGLQKWVFSNGEWKLAYTLQSGLGLGTPYAIANGPHGEVYPTGTNPATGLPWTPATDGLRNITGRLNSDGTATIYAITSTVSGNGDQGADPNRLVVITDKIDTGSATTPPVGETFKILRQAGYGEVLRGVSFAPGSQPNAADE